MTRFVSVTVLVMVLAAGRVASAQTTPSAKLPSGASIYFEHLQVTSGGKRVEPELTSDVRLRYFNLAHCNCAKAKQGDEQTFSYAIRETMDSGIVPSVPLDLWVGTGCTVDTARNGASASCKKLASIADIDVNLYPSPTVQEFNLFEVINGKLHENDQCQQTEGSVVIYGLVSTTNTADTYDFNTSQPVGTNWGETATINVVDTLPPPAPANIAATSIDGGVHISWRSAGANNTDVAYYQALCAKTDGTPARAKDEDRKYVTTRSLCDVGTAAVGDPALDVATLDNGGTPVAAPTGEFGALNDMYLCGHANNGTSTSLDVSGLENGTPYQLILVAVDLHGNYHAAYLSSTVTPVPAIDFWEDLHDRGSDAQGGLCLLAETYGDDSSLTNTLRAFRDDTLGGSPAGRWLGRLYYATVARLGAAVHGTVVLRIVAAITLAPVVALALLWHWLTLPGLMGVLLAMWLWRRGALARWRRRLHGPIRVSAAIGMLALWASRAHAGGYQPYWENSNIPSGEDEHVALDDPGLVSWHAGVRVGPYLPEIDKQLNMTQGAFAQMFGGARPMPMLDVDRVLWTGFGQVAVGGSIGYMQWFAHQYVFGSNATDAPRARSPGDSNTFRLIPLALSATYRFTYLDDEYGVPVVPYAKGGLAYDLWWLSANGDHVCKDGTQTAGCAEDKPFGGSLGVQGAIGLAIRAERVDASTANSMRQSGIQHAGIYGELSLAKVDGFGSDKKLSLGDRTWFAGVDFEF